MSSIKLDNSTLAGQTLFEIYIQPEMNRALRISNCLSMASVLTAGISAGFYAGGLHNKVSKITPIIAFLVSSVILKVWANSWIRQYEVEKSLLDKSVEKHKEAILKLLTSLKPTVNSTSSQTSTESTPTPTPAGSTSSPTFTRSEFRPIFPDVKDNKFLGLSNKGNTCFICSTLVGLYWSVPKIFEAIRKGASLQVVAFEACSQLYEKYEKKNEPIVWSNPEIQYFFDSIFWMDKFNLVREFINLSDLELRKEIQELIETKYRNIKNFNYYAINRIDVKFNEASRSWPAWEEKDCQLWKNLLENIPIDKIYELVEKIYQEMRPLSKACELIKTIRSPEDFSVLNNKDIGVLRGFLIPTEKSYYSEEDPSELIVRMCGIVYKGDEEHKGIFPTTSNFQTFARIDNPDEKKEVKDSALYTSVIQIPLTEEDEHKSAQDLITELLSVNTKDSDHEWKDDTTQVLYKAESSQLKIEEPYPEELIIALGRFSANGSKIQYPIKFEPIISIQGINYEVKAISIHIGSYMHFGHYVTTIRDGNRFFKINDDEVKEQTMDNFTQDLDIGYVYFLRKT